MKREKKVENDLKKEYEDRVATTRKDSVNNNFLLNGLLMQKKKTLG